jgi:hypothetical protein
MFDGKLSGNRVNVFGLAIFFVWFLINIKVWGPIITKVRNESLYNLTTFHGILNYFKGKIRTLARIGSSVIIAPFSSSSWNWFSALITIPDSFREDILRADLDNAWAFLFRGRQQGRKIEIMGKYHIPFFSGPGHDLPVSGGGRTYQRPMNSLPGGGGKELHPAGRQIHINQYFHHKARGTSRSSARQAAYDRA